MFSLIIMVFSYVVSALRFSKRVFYHAKTEATIEAARAKKASLENALAELRQKIALESEIRSLKRQIFWHSMILKVNRFKMIRFCRWLSKRFPRSETILCPSFEAESEDPSALSLKHPAREDDEYQNHSNA